MRVRTGRHAIEELRKAGTLHDYGSTQVNLPASLSARLIAWGKANFPDSVLAAKGRETSPHITVKYGIVSDGSKPSIARALRGFDELSATLGEVFIFDTKTDYDVVAVEVFSETLVAANNAIKKGVDCVDTFPVYCPHLTICYVEKGAAVHFEGNTDFDGIDLTFDKVWYSTRAGEMVPIRLGKRVLVKGIRAVERAEQSETGVGSMGRRIRITDLSKAIDKKDKSTVGMDFDPPEKYTKSSLLKHNIQIGPEPSEEEAHNIGHEVIGLRKRFNLPDVSVRPWMRDNAQSLGDNPDDDVNRIGLTGNTNRWRADQTRMAAKYAHSLTVPPQENTANQREHTLGMFPDKPAERLMVDHEFGHIVHGNNKALFDDIFDHEDSDGKPDWKSKHAITADAEKTPHECVAENFSAYVNGAHHLMHPDMISRFKSIDNDRKINKAIDKKDKSTVGMDFDAPQEPAKENRYKHDTRPFSESTIPEGTKVKEFTPSNEIESMYGHFTTEEPLAVKDMKHYRIYHAPRSHDTVSPGQKRLDLGYKASMEFKDGKLHFENNGKKEVHNYSSAFAHLPADTPQNRAAFTPDLVDHSIKKAVDKRDKGATVGMDFDAPTEEPAQENRYKTMLRPIGLGTTPSHAKITDIEAEGSHGSKFGHFTTHEPLTPEELRHFDIQHAPTSHNSVVTGQKRIDGGRGLAVKMSNGNILGNSGGLPVERKDNGGFRDLPADTPQNRAAFTDGGELTEHTPADLQRHKAEEAAQDVKDKADVNAMNARMRAAGVSPPGEYSSPTPYVKKAINIMGESTQKKGTRVLVTGLSKAIDKRDRGTVGMDFESPGPAVKRSVPKLSLGEFVHQNRNRQGMSKLTLHDDILDHDSVTPELIASKLQSHEADTHHEWGTSTGGQVFALKKKESPHVDMSIAHPDGNAMRHTQNANGTFASRVVKPSGYHIQETEKLTGAYHRLVAQGKISKAIDKRDRGTASLDMGGEEEPVYPGVSAAQAKYRDSDVGILAGRETRLKNAHAALASGMKAAGRSDEDVNQAIESHHAGTHKNVPGMPHYLEHQEVHSAIGMLRHERGMVKPQTSGTRYGVKTDEERQSWADKHSENFMKHGTAGLEGFDRKGMNKAIDRRDGGTIGMDMDEDEPDGPANHVIMKLHNMSGKHIATVQKPYDGTVGHMRDVVKDMHEENRANFSMGGGHEKSVWPSRTHTHGTDEHGMHKYTMFPSNDIAETGSPSEKYQSGGNVHPDIRHEGLQPMAGSPGNPGTKRGVTMYKAIDRRDRATVGMDFDSPGEITGHAARPSETPAKKTRAPKMANSLPLNIETVGDVKKAHAWGRESSKDWHAGLSPAQKDDVRSLNEPFSNINASLRGISKPHNEEPHNRRVKRMDDAMSGASLPHAVTIHHGINNVNLKDKIEAGTAVGEVHHEKGFMLGSLRKSGVGNHYGGGNMMAHTTLPAGHKAAYLEGNDAHGYADPTHNSLHIGVARGQNLKVTKAYRDTKGVHHVHLEPHTELSKAVDPDDKQTIGMDFGDRPKRPHEMRLGEYVHQNRDRSAIGAHTLHPDVLDHATTSPADIHKKMQGEHFNTTHVWGASNGGEIRAKKKWAGANMNGSSHLHMTVRSPSGMTVSHREKTGGNFEVATEGKDHEFGAETRKLADEHKAHVLSAHAAGKPIPARVASDFAPGTFDKVSKALELQERILKAIDRRDKGNTGALDFDDLPEPAPKSKRGTVKVTGKMPVVAAGGHTHDVSRETRVPVGQAGGGRWTAGSNPSTGAAAQKEPAPVQAAQDTSEDEGESIPVTFDGRSGTLTKTGMKHLEYKLAVGKAVYDLVLPPNRTDIYTVMDKSSRRKGQIQINADGAKQVFKNEIDKSKEPVWAAPVEQPTQPAAVETQPEKGPPKDALPVSQLEKVETPEPAATPGGASETPESLKAEHDAMIQKYRAVTQAKMDSTLKKMRLLSDIAVNHNFPLRQFEFAFEHLTDSYTSKADLPAASVVGDKLLTRGFAVSDREAKDLMNARGEELDHQTEAIAMFEPLRQLSNKVKPERAPVTSPTPGFAMPTPEPESTLLEDTDEERAPEPVPAPVAAPADTSAPTSGPIGSGDANAGDRLAAKLAAFERRQALMTAINKIVKKKGATVQNSVPEILKLGGISEASARKLFEPDYMGRVGFPSYMLTNNSAEIRRLKGRVESVVKHADDTTAEHTFDGGHLVDNVADNRVQLFFDSKPDDEQRAKLRGRGFKWAPSIGAWQRFRGDGVVNLALSLVKKG